MIVPWRVYPPHIFLQKYLSPEYPDPSKLAILFRTLPLRHTGSFKPFHCRVQSLILRVEANYLSDPDPYPKPMPTHLTKEIRTKRTWAMSESMRLGRGIKQMLSSKQLDSSVPGSWVVVSNIFYFHPYLVKIPILTNIFQMG